MKNVRVYRNFFSARLRSLMTFWSSGGAHIPLIGTDGLAFSGDG